MDVELAGVTVALPRVDPAELSAAARIDALEQLAGLRAWVDAQEQRLLAAMAEPGEPPVSSADPEVAAKQYVREEIACVLRLAPSSVNARLHIARELVRRLPDTLGALERGMIGLPYARCLAEAVGPLSDAPATAVQARVLPAAGRQTLRAFRLSVTRAVLALDPRKAEEQHEHPARGRRVEARMPDHGMGSIYAELTADAAQAVLTGVQAAADALAAAEVGAGTAAAERRTADQLRADAFVALVLGQPLDVRATWQGRRPTVNVSVGLSTLLELDDEPGDLDGFGPIPAALARRMAADRPGHGGGWSPTPPAASSTWAGPRTRRRSTSRSTSWRATGSVASPGAGGGPGAARSTTRRRGTRAGPPTPATSNAAAPGTITSSTRRAGRSGAIREITCCGSHPPGTPTSTRPDDIRSTTP